MHHGCEQCAVLVGAKRSPDMPQQLTVVDSGGLKLEKVRFASVVTKIAWI